MRGNLPSALRVFRHAEILNFLQINIRKNCSARNMMEKTAKELLTDIIILSEVPKEPPDSLR